MTVSGARLWRAIRYITSLPVGTQSFEIGKELLIAQTDRWPRMLSHWRGMYGSGPEHETCTALERILRGIEAAA